MSVTLKRFLCWNHPVRLKHTFFVTSSMSAWAWFGKRKMGVESSSLWLGTICAKVEIVKDWLNLHPRVGEFFMTAGCHTWYKSRWLWHYFMHLVLACEGTFESSLAFLLLWLLVIEWSFFGYLIRYVVGHVSRTKGEQRVWWQQAVSNKKSNPFIAAETSIFLLLH